MEKLGDSFEVGHQVRGVEAIRLISYSAFWAWRKRCSANNASSMWKSQHPPTRDCRVRTNHARRGCMCVVGLFIDVQAPQKLMSNEVNFCVNKYWVVAS